MISPRSCVPCWLGPFLKAVGCSFHGRRRRLRLGRSFLPPSASSADRLLRRRPGYLQDNSGGGSAAVRMLVVRPPSGRGWFDSVPSLGERLVQLLEKRFQRFRGRGWRRNEPCHSPVCGIPAPLPVRPRRRCSRRSRGGRWTPGVVRRHRSGHYSAACMPHGLCRGCHQSGKRRQHPRIARVLYRRQRRLHGRGARRGSGRRYSCIASTAGGVVAVDVVGSFPLRSPHPRRRDREACGGEHVGCCAEYARGV